MRILVADDDTVYRTLLSDLLKQWQFEVHAVTDGRAAWEEMQKTDCPRIVVLDWKMPFLDGFEVARLIRTQRPGPGVYVILITGSGNKDEIMKVLVCGADDYLIKPFDPIDLKIRLRTALRVLDLEDEVALLQKSSEQTDPAPAAG